MFAMGFGLPLSLLVKIHCTEVLEERGAVLGEGSTRWRRQGTLQPAQALHQVCGCEHDLKEAS